MSISAFFKQYNENNIEAIIPSIVSQREREESTYFSCLRRKKAVRAVENGLPQTLINVLTQESTLFLIYSQSWSKYSLSKGWNLIEEGQVSDSETIIHSSVSPAGHFLILITQEEEENEGSFGI